MRQAHGIGANVNWSQVMARAYFVRGGKFVLDNRREGVATR